ncbi:MAG: MlaD family protein [Flavipsychrobacter sp.]
MSSKKRNWISTLLLIAVAVSGYFIYQNSYWVTDYYQYRVYYPDIYGLLPSDPVYLKGVKVGRVSKIEYRGQENILVTMSISKDIPIQENTIAQLSASGLQGSKHIKLLLDSVTEKTLAHQSELIAQYDTTVIQTSTLINPMIASAKYYVRSLDSSLSNINEAMKDGAAKKIKNDIVTLRNNFYTFSQNTNTLKEQGDDILHQLAAFKTSSDEVAASIDSFNASIKTTSKTFTELSKTTIKKDLAELSKNIRSFSKAIKEIKNDSSFNQLIADKKLYTTAAGKLDTIQGKIQEAKDDPKPISILGK